MSTRKSKRKASEFRNGGLACDDIDEEEDENEVDDFRSPIGSSVSRRQPMVHDANCLKHAKRKGGG